MAFQVARQLGLGCVLADQDDEAYDYRLRGWWLEEDLRAWPESLARQAAALAAPVPDETPAQLNERLIALAEALAEHAMADTSTNALIAAEGAVVELHAYAFGVRPA
ncbi:MAG: hypothetical protein M3P34_04000, partial [Actinomycetota bacterium]|nr:hypothetical protein [Actinomycetota bacterium]